jgi:hypothetical protein
VGAVHTAPTASPARGWGNGLRRWYAVTRPWVIIRAIITRGLGCGCREGSDTWQQSALAPITCLGSDCTSTNMWGADVWGVALYYVPVVSCSQFPNDLDTYSGSILPAVHGWGGCHFVYHVVR